MHSGEKDLLRLLGFGEYRSFALPELGDGYCEGGTILREVRRHVAIDDVPVQEDKVV